MNSTFETFETIAHNVIDKVESVTVIITKAIVTLLCLGGSIAYESGIKLREILDANNATLLVANEDVSLDEVSNVIDGPTQAVDYAGVDAEYPTVDCIERPEGKSQVVDCADVDAELTPNIHIIKPISKTNSIEIFIKVSLHNELSNNYLEIVSYKLPRNRRTKKTHVRYGNLGILKEHYAILMASNILK